MTPFSTDPLNMLARQTLDALEDGQAEAALVTLGALEATVPGHPVVLHLLGLASLKLEEPGKALGAFEAAHRAAPAVYEHAEALGIVHARLGRVTDALFYAKLAIAATERAEMPGLLPEWLGEFSQSFYNMPRAPLAEMGGVAAASEAWERAAEFYLKAVEVDRGDAAAWRGLATASLRLGRGHHALMAAHALAENGGSTIADRALAAEAYAMTGQWDAAIDRARDLAWQTDDPTLAWHLPRLMLARPDAEPTAVAAAMAAWATRFAPEAAAPAARIVSPLGIAKRRLRLGLVVSDWSEGGLAALRLPTLVALPKRSVALYFYADGRVQGAVAKRAEAAAEMWQDISALDEETAAFTIANDAPDALIDLDGPLRRLRPGLYLRRPVPLCLGWLDLTEAAAALGFDGTIGGAGTYPKTGAGVPMLALPFAAGLAPELSSAPPACDDGIPEMPLGASARRETGPVLGSLAPRSTIATDTVRLWSEIVRAVPGARLRFLGTALGGPQDAAEVTALFHALGVEIEIDAAQPMQAAFLSGIDVLLDPPGDDEPDGAIAAVAAGVPAVALAGATPQKRLAAAWLSDLGFPELAASSPAAYAACVSAALQPGLRARLRAASIEATGRAASHNAAALEAGLRAWIESREAPT